MRKNNIIRKLSLRILCFCLPVIITSCSNQPVEKTTIHNDNNSANLITDTLKSKEENFSSSDIDQEVVMSDELVDILSINSSIQVDIKYATTDNFMGKQLYYGITKIFLQKEVAIKLSECQKYLKKINQDLSLLVYDGARPLHVQQAMWDALDTIPVQERTKFVSNPANGSIHNYGAAVDLTICTVDGKVLDMGAGYDDIRKVAYPKFEKEFLKSGELTNVQVENRKLLRNVMLSQGFKNIATEWWHFNACSREEAKARYSIIK